MNESQYPPLPDLSENGEIWKAIFAWEGAFHRTRAAGRLDEVLRKSFHAYIDADRAQRKPLTDAWMEENIGPANHPMAPLIQMVVRKTEAAHGINPPPRPDAGNN